MEPISKKDIKLDKILKKRLTNRLQNSQVSQNLLQDKKINDNDQILTVEYIDPLTQLKKAKQWWQNLDFVYYKSIKRKNILLTRDLTSAQKLVNFFSSQSQLQSSYQNEEIYEKFPLLTQNTLIHVLFKSSTPFFIQLITFSFANYIQSLSKRSTKNSKQQNQEPIDLLQGCDIFSCIKKLKNSIPLSQNTLNFVQQGVKIGNLQFEAILHDDTQLCKFQKTQQIKYNMQFEQDIEVQLELWEHQALHQNTKNSILWNNLISNHQKNLEVQHENFLLQVSKIKETLMHHTILRYIQHGTRDKTQQMLKLLLDNMKMIKPAKTRQATNKKFFQTDCKICFCSFNSDSNQVLYCDMCNTSFHLACYGLHQVPQDKQYFCDRCIAIKKDQKTKNNIRKITCQICCKPNFPIKQIDGHYYHMTCLIFFNFITIRQGMIQLKEGLSHQTIIKKVIQSQMECQSCIFCMGGQGAELGLRFQCNKKGCETSMHPICAYINGCLFDVNRNMEEKKIEVSISCNQHDCQRDYIQQTYLRRYMCNFKNTSQKPLQSFRTQHHTEIISRKQKLQSSLTPKSIFKSQLPKIIIDTKIVKRHISQRQQKNAQKPQQVQNTQIRKLLERLERPKNRL